MNKEQLNKIVDSLLAKGLGPSTIGHILRDEYKVKVRKLTKFCPQLNQKKYEIDKLALKIKYLTLHLQNNKKDYPSQRRLVAHRIKLINLKK